MAKNAQAGIFILSGKNITSLMVEDVLKKICKPDTPNLTPTFSGTWATVLTLEEAKKLRQFQIDVKPIDHNQDDNNGLIFAALKINAIQKSKRYPPRP